MSDLNSRIEAAKAEVENLAKQIQKTQNGKRDQGLGAVARTKAQNPAPIRNPPTTKMRRCLKGHFGKVTAMHWGGDSRHLVSAGQDGNLLIWNAVTSNKVQAITLKSSYVMSVGYEQTKGELVACGGLDNLCTVYKLSSPDQAMEMASHDGLITCCRFLDDTKILTSSGDSTCIRWDIARGTVLDTFAGHKEHINFMSLSPTDKNVFVSSSVDKTAKVWDIRASKSCVQTFMGHTGDVNGVDFMPADGNCFATCTEDGGIRIFDMRAYNELSLFKVNLGGAGANNDPGVAEDKLTSLAFSKSGRILFVGHSDGSVLAFDVMAERATPAFTMAGAHERHIASLGVSPSGEALCTGSWDTTLKVWA
ncbi:nucleotide-binding protein G(I)/G(S)/G(T) subunit [Seminavis robusta]|uniref:Nucleotide-binding protein G(I)/G(S)/G(T) subunit n=1 Tax=Seminavis robusta TaxID=568900 RepID=A0A9N8HL33_9STRA|nr:nucleotide-binding protein G(I)/G(S)/G(T) subunit [Seminavis robusta]|eukprot:Sro795_g203560.1 nucleotide-binding protein G(I)/G(S)/G(T) subunit (364) ;mRNA; r:33019-34431